ncbi:hypothetical protein [Vibrio sp. CAU 1672]|uniref:hypothetical protein n=1 Tax=Vibrio sp. CAU 1672 TaxID=3032594 RepID=UPI0023DBFB79|nr:hypothetical protein [Vibrio sp. CAU 1672]MDF2152911.1 hypothetical protein [Vibrio sp. CAU 1672]
MRFSMQHTTWLTLFAALVLLVSSVANSTPMIMSQPAAAQNVMLHDHSTMLMSESEHCALSTTASRNTPSADHCNPDVSMSCDEGGKAHSCCTATCSLVFVPSPDSVSRAAPLAFRSVIHQDSISPVVQISRDLFRPPIA